MSASYDSSSVESVDVEITPVTAEWLIEQSRIAEQTLPPADLRTVNIADYRYVIKPADILLISVPTIVSFNASAAPSILGEQGQGYVVYHDGTIYLPFSGPVIVGGLTIRDAQERIVQALSRYLKTPQVIVSVQDFRSQRVMVTGQVPRPGYVPITDVPLTLIGALAASGSISELRGRFDPRPVGVVAASQQVQPEYPDLRNLLLKRGGITHTINLDRALASGDATQDVLLADGDVVIVPPAKRANVFVLGEVIRPSMFEIAANDTNLAQVLMAGGGMNQLTANASRLYVIRGDLSKARVYQIDAESPDALLLAQEFKMRPRDIVYVATAGVTRWNRFLQQLLPSLQSLVSGALFADRIDSISE